jgi:replicative DNA helicase
VLGAMMLDKDAVATVIDILQPDSFYVEAHRQIYKAICSLFEKSNPVDLLTVSEELKKMAVLEMVGGPFYLVELTNRVASSANIEYHARIVAQKFIQRELIRVSTETIKDAYEDTTDVFDLLDKSEQNLFAITEKNLSRGTMSMSTLVNMSIKQFEELSKKADGLTGVPTGFTGLDRVTSGWQPSDLIIVAARPGMGKCLGKGTKIVMYDGSLKNVENVLPGDQLMGDDSTPRNVLSICRGREQMYWVHQNKGISYRVNESHILSLKRSRNEGSHKKGTVLNIELRNWIGKSKKFQSNYKGYKVAIELSEKETLLSPYFLGLWLGDGTSSDANITNTDQEVTAYLEGFAQDRGFILNVRKHKNRAQTLAIVGGKQGHKGHSLKAELQELGVLNNKHIPDNYLYNSSQKRLELLAGLLDSDGHYLIQSNGYEITQNNKFLVQQIKYLCDSLGFRVSINTKKASIRSTGFESTVYRLRIYGDIDRIPVKINYKAARAWASPVDWRVSGISIEQDIVDDYYGFEIDGNHLFLLEDMTVTHNTSFTLAITKNAALDFNQGVAFFSLEMSSVQLVNRIISMETQIESEKLRKGRLEDYEWQQLYSVVDRLSNVPIFIDDTPGISIFELRAKCRRLKMQHDIKLIIIDYLQLMTAGGDGKNGNREQEISAISRSLKGLAKELSVPVIALSQLSRAVETRGGSKRPQLSDLRECVSGDTKVLLRDGSWSRIDSLIGQKPDLWAVETETQKLKSAISDMVWEVGKKEIFELTLSSGRKIKASAEHRLFGPNGWQRVHNIKIGDRLALIRQIPEPENCLEIEKDKLLILAHLIGDGSYLKGQPLRYTTASELHSNAVKSAAENGFGVTVNRHESSKGSWHQLVFSGNGNRWSAKGIGAWFKALGIFNQRSKEKIIPRQIFRLNNENLAFFLRHLWATDGTIFVPKKDKSASKIAFSTNSPQLAEDVSNLLLRFGIHSRIKKIEQGKNYNPMFNVEISGLENQKLFLDRIGAFGEKVKQANALSLYLQNKTSNTNVDTIPNDIFDKVKLLLREKGISQRKMAELRGTSYGGSAHFNFAPSRKVLAEYANILESEELKKWAESDLFWDEVINIQSLGEETVYDLTVPEEHNWIANGILSHNSGAIEQDADIVSFIYRPEYYQILEDEDGNSLKGIGEIIIAKHRNGALEDVRLKWDGQYALFSNLDDDAFRNFSQDDFGSNLNNNSNNQTFNSKLNNQGNTDDVPF